MGKYLDKSGLARLWDKVVAERRAKALTNQNLNDIKTDGYYYAAGNNSVTGGPNGTYDADSGKRKTVSGGFGLRVQRVANGWYRQELWLVDDGSTWQRHWNSFAWSTWQRTNEMANTLMAGGDAWQHTFSTNNAMYIRLMVLRKVSGYVNTPVTFMVAGRSGEPAQVSIAFTNDNKGDANLARFCYVGNAAYGKNLVLYRKKASEEGHGQWELWLKQTQGYDSGYLYDIHVPDGIGVKLTWNTAASLPVLSTNNAPTDFLSATWCSQAKWALASTAQDGLMSAADKGKLDGLGTGPKAIAKGTDLGTIKEPGMYHWDYSGQGATSSADAPKNMPKSLAWNGRFTMLVVQAGASTAWQVIPADSYTPTKFYARTIATTGTTAVNRSWYVFDLSSLRELDA